MQNKKYLKKLQDLIKFSNVIILLTGFLLVSCENCKYFFTSEYIRSTCPIYQSVYFQELKVDSFNNINLPQKYIVIREISLSLIHEGLKPKKKIYFYKENPNYEWNDITNGRLSKTLPFKMQPGTWYKIRGLVFLGQPSIAAFIKLKDDGRIEVHQYKEQTNW